MKRSIIILFLASSSTGMTKDELVDEVMKIRDQYFGAMRESTRIEDAQKEDYARCDQAEKRLFKIHDMKITDPSPSDIEEVRSLLQVVENCKSYKYHIEYMDFVQEKVFTLFWQADSCDDLLVEHLRSKPKVMDISEFTDWAHCIGLYVGAVKGLKRRYPEYDY